MKPTPDTVKVAKTRYIVSPRGKFTIIILLKEHSNKMIPNDIMLSVSVPPNPLAADGNYQRPTTGQCA